jgi:anti-anti-sigma factor
MSITITPVTASTQLQLDISWPSPSTALVAVTGEVDLATAPVLRDRLLGVLREQAPAVVEVDLAGVTFLDCTAISALVAVRNAAIQAGGQMRVSHPQPIVRQVLDVTGLLDLFTTPIDEAQPLAPPDPGSSVRTPNAALGTNPPNKHRRSRGWPSESAALPVDARVSA